MAKKNPKEEAAVRGGAVPLWVQEISGSDDGLDQGFGPYRLLRRRLGAGVRLPALLVPHGFNVAAAPHATTRDLVILPVARVTPPIILRHLRRQRKGWGWWATRFDAERGVSTLHAKILERTPKNRVCDYNTVITRTLMCITELTCLKTWPSPYKQFYNTYELIKWS